MLIEAVVEPADAPSDHQSNQRFGVTFVASNPSDADRMMRRSLPAGEWRAVSLRAVMEAN